MARGEDATKRTSNTFLLFLISISSSVAFVVIHVEVLQNVSSSNVFYEKELKYDKNYQQLL